MKKSGNKFAALCHKEENWFGMGRTEISLPQRWAIQSPNR
jgi:hypothetical protein